MRKTRYVLSSTFYPDPDHSRFHDGCDTLRAFREQEDTRVVLVHGSPKDREAARAVREGLLEAGGRDRVSILDEPSEMRGNLTAVRRLGFQEVRNRMGKDPRVPGLWTELEKTETAGHYRELAGPIERGEAHGVVPGRIEQGWASYPENQRLSEQLGNRYLGQMMGLFFDWFHGPKLFNCQVVPYFADYQNEADRAGYGVLIIPLYRAHKDDLRVVGQEYPFRLSPRLRSEEEANPRLQFVKRPKQFSGLCELIFGEMVRQGAIVEAQQQML